MTTQRFTPLPKVNSQYGAPMGRRDSADRGAFSDISPAKLCASYPQGEYDSGGAYWGTGGNEGPVYAVWAKGKGHKLGVCYVRAMGPKSAISKVLSGEA